MLFLRENLCPIESLDNRHVWLVLYCFCYHYNLLVVDNEFYKFDKFSALWSILSNSIKNALRKQRYSCSFWRHFFPIDLVLCAVCPAPGLQRTECNIHVFIPSNLIGLRCFRFHWLGRLISLFCVLFSLLVISCSFFVIQQHSVPSFADVDLYKWCLLEFDYFHLCDLKRAKRFETVKKSKRIAFNSTFVSIALPSYSNFNSILLSILPSLSWDV